MLKYQSRKPPREYIPVYNNLSWKIWLLSAVLLLTLLFPLKLASQVFSPEVKKVSENFVCQCSCNHQLSACGMLHCGSANPLRTEIAQKLKSGETEETIVKEFVVKYGKLILSAPSGEGFDLVAWTLPIIAFLGGLIVIYAVTRTWLRRQISLAPSQGESDVIPNEYQEKLKKELNDRD